MIARPNPYVGPRAFEIDEALYGRERELRQLKSLLVAERIVLLHSPSGAGKTSLIQARLIPNLRKGFNVLPVIRVNLEPPVELQNLDGFNRYTFSTLAALEEGQPAEKHLANADLATLSLETYIEQRIPPGDAVLIFDQFEEILTVSPADREAKASFFAGLGAALRNPDRWTLFSMREDFIGALDPYLRPIPGQLESRYRLDLLGPDAARQAIQKPAREAGVDFTNEAAKKLVDDLRVIQVQQPDGSTETLPGPYVEPVQLQVVCYNLWETGAADEGSIAPDDLQRIGSIDQSLAAYYANSIQKASETGGVDERLIRQWFEQSLITPEGVRSQVLRSQVLIITGFPEVILSQLESAHLIRGETRAGKLWYELAHDRLVEPVRQSNAKWFEANLSLLQKQAALWASQKRSEGLLLRGKAFEEAEKGLSAIRLTADEQSFLDACLSLRKRENDNLHQRRYILAGLVTSLVLLVTAIFFSYFLYNTTVANHLLLNTAQTSEANAQAASTKAVQSANNAGTSQANAISNANIAATSQANAFESAKLAATAQAKAEVALARVASVASYRADALVAFSNETRNTNNPVSTLLALEAYKIVDNYRTRGNLMEIVKSKLQIRQFPNNYDHTNFGLYVVKYSLDGNLLASGNDNGSVSLWDSLNYQPIVGLSSGNIVIVYSIAFRQDGMTLASGNGDGTIILWNVATHIPMQTLTIHSNYRVYAVAFSPNGQILASSSEDCNIIFWDVAKSVRIGQPLKYAGQEIRSVNFSPDGKMLASSIDNSVILLDVTTHMPIGQPLVGHRDSILTLEFSPDGKILASGSKDKTIILWNVESREPIGYPLSGHIGPVRSVAFSSDGKTLASSSEDGTVIIWDVASGKQIGQLSSGSNSSMISLDFYPSGKTLVSGNSDGTITLWNVDIQSWIEMACQIAGRNMSESEWRTYFPGEEYRITCPQWPLKPKTTITPTP